MEWASRTQVARLPAEAHSSLGRAPEESGRGCAATLSLENGRDSTSGVHEVGDRGRENDASLNGTPTSPDWAEGFLSGQQKQQAPGERRPLRYGDVIVVTDSGLSLEVGKGGDGVRCAQALPHSQGAADGQWRVGWGKIRVRVREKLERDIAVGDILCPSGANDGTSVAVCARELEEMGMEEMCSVGKHAFAVVLDASDSSERLPGVRVEDGIRVVTAWATPSVFSALSAEFARRLNAVSSEQAATKALAEQALAQSAKTERALCNLQARFESLPTSGSSAVQRQAPTAQTAALPGSRAFNGTQSGSDSGPTPMDCSEELLCSFCSQTDHDKEDCPSQVLVDLRTSGDMAPVRQNSQSPRVGSKRSNSESSLASASGRSMLTQSSPALRTDAPGGSPTKKKSKKSIATSAGASLKRSGNYMALGDPRAKNINAIIGLPRLADIPIAFPPQKDELLGRLSAGEGIPGLHVISLAKTGRHTQEDIVSVLGCIGPNPIFKKMKLLFVWVPDKSGRSHSSDFKPTLTVRITRLHPDHPSTLVIEGDGGDHKAEASFELSPGASVPVILRPDHPRKVGGHSALFDVEVLVGQRKLIDWNVQVYNSRYGPRLVHERPERTPYSRPPAVCTFSYKEGMWSAGVAFLKEADGTTSAVPPPPAKMRRTDEEASDASHTRSSSLGLSRGHHIAAVHPRSSSLGLTRPPSLSAGANGMAITSAPSSQPSPLHNSTTVTAASSALIAVAAAATAATSAPNSSRAGKGSRHSGAAAAAAAAGPRGGTTENRLSGNFAAAAAAAAAASSTGSHRAARKESLHSENFTEGRSASGSSAWGENFSEDDAAAAAAAAAAAMAGTSEARGQASGFSQPPSQASKDNGNGSWRRAPIGSQGGGERDRGSVGSTSAAGLAAMSSGSRASSGHQETLTAAAAAAAAAAAFANSPSVSSLGGAGGRSGSQGFTQPSSRLGLRGSTDGMAYPRLVYSSLNSFGHDNETPSRPMEQPPP